MLQNLHDQGGERANVLRVISFIFKDRSFIAICIAGMLLLASNMFTQTYYLYLFNSYFNASGLYLAVNAAAYLPMFAVMPFMGVLVRKAGKAELCSAGMAFAGVVQIALCFIRTSNRGDHLRFLPFHQEAGSDDSRDSGHVSLDLD